MTLSELLPKSYAFNFGAELHLRYDMNALLELEKSGLEYGDIFSDRIKGTQVLAFLHAGLCEDIGREREIGIVTTLGVDEVWRHCQAAVLLSLPEPDPTIIPDTRSAHSDGKADFGRLRCLVCDIMKKPEEFFWTSTLRELVSRWQQFAVIKGYAKEPERMQMFDTEGM